MTLSAQLLWDILTIGSQALVVVLTLDACFYRWRFPTWSLAWVCMLLAQTLGLLLRIGTTVDLHGWAIPSWVLDRVIPLTISLALVYFLLTARRMFTIRFRPRTPQEGTPHGVD